MFVLIVSPRSAILFSFHLLPLRGCSAGAIVRHDGWHGWHAGWWVNIFEFIIVCISVFWVNFGSREHANSKPHFSLITVFIFVDDSLPGFLDADGFEEGKSQSYYWNFNFFYLGMCFHRSKWLLNCRIPRHLLTCYGIRIACLVLQKVSTHWNEQPSGFWLVSVMGYLLRKTWQHLFCAITAVKRRFSLTEC